MLIKKHEVLDYVYSFQFRWEHNSVCQLRWDNLQLKIDFLVYDITFQRPAVIIFDFGHLETHLKSIS